jgi:excisionase family DNA binding protein
MEVGKLLYSRKDAARLLSISLRSVDYMIAAGKLKTRKIGSRILIPASAIQRMAETGCPYGVIEQEAA